MNNDREQVMREKNMTFELTDAEKDRLKDAVKHQIFGRSDSDIDPAAWDMLLDEMIEACHGDIHRLGFHIVEKILAKQAYQEKQRRARTMDRGRGRGAGMDDYDSGLEEHPRFAKLPQGVSDDLNANIAQNPYAMENLEKMDPQEMSPELRLAYANRFTHQKQYANERRFNPTPTFSGR